MNWMKYKIIYFLLSGALLSVGIFSIIRWGFNPSIDFVGGSIIEYRFENDIAKEEIEKILAENKNIKEISIDQKSAILRMKPIDQTEAANIKSKLEQDLNEKVEELRFENVGPTFSHEILTKTLVAALIASLGILGWVASQFKNFKFGLCAVLAMFHDTGIVLGAISLAGHFLKVEIDFLLVTAVLTTLSFSVHDTIIVYDRIRELQKKNVSQDFLQLVNTAIDETIVRSLNNTLAIVFMLVAILLLGGTTIRWFTAILLIGTISGAYSSPFVAVPLLVTWDQLQNRKKKFYS